MREHVRAAMALGLIVATGVAVQGCGGSRHNGFFSTQATGSASTVSIAFAGYVPVGTPQAFTAGNLTAVNAATLTFLPGLLPAGRTTADIVVLHRDDTTGSVTVLKPLGLDPVAQTVTVSLAGPGTYQAQAPVQPDASRSTITVTPSSGIPADGTSAATILVTVRDANGTLLSGQTVTLAASGSGNTLTQPSGPTDFLGQATAKIVSTAAETKTLTATINATSAKPIVLPTVPVTFGTAGAPSPTASTVAVSPAFVVATGVDTARITIVVRNSTNMPLAGIGVTVGAVGTLALIAQPLPTDAAGVTFATIASPYPGPETIVVTANGVTLNQQPTVTFQASVRNVYVGTDSNTVTSVQTNAPSLSVFAADDAAGGSGQLRPTVSVSENSFGPPSSIAVDARNRRVFFTSSTGLVSAPLSGRDGFGAFDAFLGPISTPLPGGGTGFETAVDPTGRFVYVALNTNPATIVNFVVNQVDGSLNAGNATPFYGTYGFQNGSAATSIALHPTGRFLYAASIFNSPPSVTAFRLDPNNGNPTQVGAALTMGFGQPGEIACDPQGRYLVGVDEGANVLYIFGIDPNTGELTELDEVDIPGRARKPIVDASGRFIYVPIITGTPSDQVAVYTVDASLLGAPGAILSPRVPPSAVLFDLGGNVPDNGFQGPVLATEPSGHFLSVVSQTTSEIVTFTIDPTSGALSSPQSVRTQPGPISIATSIGASPVRYVSTRLGIADVISQNNVQAYVVNPSIGALSAPTQTTVDPSPTTLPAPISIVQDQLARFVVTADGPSNKISVETVDPASSTFFYTGTFNNGVSNTTLAQAGAAPYIVGFGSSVFSLKVQPQGSIAGTNLAPNPAASTAGGTVDPTGQWVFVVEPSANQVQGYALTLANGSLATTSNFKVPSAPSSVVVTPAGRFVYVGNGSAITYGSIDPTSGSVASLASGSVVTQSPVIALAADPLGKYLYSLSVDGSITGFSIDTTYQGKNEGELTQLGLATRIPGAVSPNAIAADPSGNFLYVIDNGLGRNNVTLLTINRATGALTVGASTTAGASPSSLVVVGGPK